MTRTFKRAFDNFIGIRNEPVYKILGTDKKSTNRLISYLTYDMQPVAFLSLLNKVVPINHYKRFRKKAHKLENLAQKEGVSIAENFKSFIGDLFIHIKENQNEDFFNKIDTISKRGNKKDKFIMITFLLKTIYFSYLLNQVGNIGIKMELS